MTKRRNEITEIVFYPIIPTDRGLVCYVSFTCQNAIRIHDCAIVTKATGGYRILYPVKTLSNGRKISSVYPISKEVGKYIEDFLLNEYNEFIKKQKED